MSLVKCGVTRDRTVKGLKGNFSKKRQCSSSFKALRQALNSLHRLDDFDSEEIGAGFFSKIYRVVHKTTKQVLVLKMNVKEGNEANVRREIDMMNKLSHPNIIKFYGVCISNGQMHALIEYINGGSLDQLLLDHTVRLAWTLRIQIACDMAKGLKYLHSNGYMHRDLTSKNILIKKYSDGRTAAVVADLGLADKIPSPTLDTPVSIVGSPYWMAPECLVGKVYNQKADVFSYGIILCEVIARVDADPEVLPRTKTFGVDYVKFCSMSSDCPLHFLHQAFVCCQIDPSKRPSFKKIVSSLQVLKSSAQMAVILADLNRLGIVNNGKNVLNRMLLEKILEEKLKQRKMTVVEDTVNSQSSPQHRCHVSPSPKHNLQTPLFNNKTLDSLPSSCAPKVTDCFSSNQIIPDTPSSSNNLLDTYTSNTQHKFVPVTPMIVGKVMSRDDVYYAPHFGNPFPASLRRDKLIEKYTNTDNDPFPGNHDHTDNQTHLKVNSIGPLKVPSKDLLTHSNSILNDCSAYLEMHSLKNHSPIVPYKRLEPVHNHLIPSLIWPSLLSPNIASLSSMAPNIKSEKSSFLPVRLFRSNSLPATPTNFFPDESDVRLNATMTAVDKATDGEDSKANHTLTKRNIETETDASSEMKCEGCGLGSYLRTLATSPGCCIRSQSNKKEKQPQNSEPSNTLIKDTSNYSPTHRLITKQPKRQSIKRAERRNEYAYISGSSSMDSALGREEEEDGGNALKKRCANKDRLRKIHSFYGCNNSNRKALIKRKNIYENVDGDDEVDFNSRDHSSNNKTHNESNDQINNEKIHNLTINSKIENKKECVDNNNDNKTNDSNHTNNSNNNSSKTATLTTTEFPRLHFRTSSAVVCRSSSAIYHHHPLTEQALLTRYLEEMLKSASTNKSRKQGGDENEGGFGGALRNKLVKEESSDEQVNNESDDEDSGDDEEDCKSVCDYDDDDYFSSSLCHTHHFNNSCCSPGSFYSLDDNLYPSSSSCADNSTTSSWAPEREQRESCFTESRDDPKRRSNKKIVDLIKNWEDKTYVMTVKGCGDEQCSFHNHANVHDFSQSKQCPFHFPLSSQYLKPMEFAEFYLYRRFQELKQKWEQNQQQ